MFSSLLIANRAEIARRVIRTAKRMAICTLAALAPATTVSAAQLHAGSTFPLSDGATPTLRSVEVHRVTSDNTIDLAVVLTAPNPAPKSGDALLAQLAEFCLRYQDDIVEMAVPAAERARMNLFVPLYQVPMDASGKRFAQNGFAFQVRDGVCTLEAPFPQGLKAAARKRAKGAVR